MNSTMTATQSSSIPSVGPKTYEDDRNSYNRSLSINLRPTLPEDYRESK